MSIGLMASLCLNGGGIKAWYENTRLKDKRGRGGLFCGFYG